ncbi:hypothetical protein [Thermogemmatispora sp.]|uniref:hypothetical protein n=1 Tax=Thermogemmatispora sp. TaxID=1968838 RepID=UPI0035E4423A
MSDVDKLSTKPVDKWLGERYPGDPVVKIPPARVESVEKLSTESVENSKTSHPDKACQDEWCGKVIHRIGGKPKKHDVLTKLVRMSDVDNFPRGR